MILNSISIQIFLIHLLFIPVLTQSIGRDGYDKKVRQLVIAIQHNDLKLVKIAISQGADINGDAYNTSTPLMACAQKIGINLAILEVLIQSGANIEAKDFTGGTALERAVLHKNVNVIKFLIKCGANVNSVDGVWFQYFEMCIAKKRDFDC